MNQSTTIDRGPITTTPDRVRLTATRIRQLDSVVCVAANALDRSFDQIESLLFGRDEDHSREVESIREIATALKADDRERAKLIAASLVETFNAFL